MRSAILGTALGAFLSLAPASSAATNSPSSVSRSEPHQISRFEPVSALSAESHSTRLTVPLPLTPSLSTSLASTLTSPASHDNSTTSPTKTLSGFDTNVLPHLVPRITMDYYRKSFDFHSKPGFTPFAQTAKPFRGMPSTLPIGQKWMPMADNATRQYCTTHWMFFWTDFQIFGSNFDEDRFGFGGEGLRQQLRGCRTLSRYKIRELKDQSWGYQWVAEGRMAPFKRSCIERAIPYGGGLPFAKCIAGKPTNVGYVELVTKTEQGVKYKTSTSVVFATSALVTETSTSVVLVSRTFGDTDLSNVGPTATAAVSASTVVEAHKNLPHAVPGSITMQDDTTKTTATPSKHSSSRATATPETSTTTLTSMLRKTEAGPTGQDTSTSTVKEQVYIPWATATDDWHKKRDVPAADPTLLTLTQVASNTTQALILTLTESPPSVVTPDTEHTTEPTAPASIVNGTQILLTTVTEAPPSAITYPATTETETTTFNRTSTARLLVPHFVSYTYSPTWLMYPTSALLTMDTQHVTIQPTTHTLTRHLPPGSTRLLTVPETVITKTRTHTSTFPPQRSSKSFVCYKDWDSAYYPIVTYPVTATRTVSRGALTQVVSAKSKVGLVTRAVPTTPLGPEERVSLTGAATRGRKATAAPEWGGEDCL